MLADERTNSDGADELVALLNAGYVCPLGAGPAWRKAVAEGVDMSLIERNLLKSPWERLQNHDQALGFVQILQRGAANAYE